MKSTSVLGICGSPRKGGMTEMLLDRALEGAKSAGCSSVEKINISDLNITPCRACEDCVKGDICSTEDDMQIMYNKTKAVDCLIIASPIFFGSLSGQMKVMIDRFQAVWASKRLLSNTTSSNKRRKGLFLCVAGQDKTEYFRNARDIIKTLFATLDIDCDGELFFGRSSVDGQENKKKDAILKEAFHLGRKLITQ